MAGNCWAFEIQYLVGYSASLTCLGRWLLEQPKNQHFPQLPILLFLVKLWLATAGTDKVSCVYSGIAPQLPWLATAALIQETLSLVRPWLVTAGTTRLECAIFHTKNIFHNDNSYERLQGLLHQKWFFQHFFGFSRDFTSRKRLQYG